MPVTSVKRLTGSQGYYAASFGEIAVAGVLGLVVVSPIARDYLCKCLKQRSKTGSEPRKGDPHFSSHYWSCKFQ
jgi:hypothetical protein